MEAGKPLDTPSCISALRLREIPCVLSPPTPPPLLLKLLGFSFSYLKTRIQIDTQNPEHSHLKIGLTILGVDNIVLEILQHIIDKRGTEIKGYF